MKENEASLKKLTKKHGEEKLNFPELAQEEFELLSKEPLWQLCKAVLYVNGLKSDRKNEQIISFLKSKNNLDKLCLYITQAHNAKKLKTVENGMGWTDWYNDSTKPNYDLITTRMIEPRSFIKFVKTLPLSLPFFAIEQSPKKLVEVKQKVIVEEKINPKRRTSLNKLVLAMAIEKYRYNPEASKNSTTSNIEDTLTKYGLTIDKNTIRDILNDAYEELKHQIDLDKDPN